MPNPTRPGQFENWLGASEPFETLPSDAVNRVGDFEHWLGSSQPFDQYVKKEAAAGPTPPAVARKSSYVFII